MKLIMLLGIIIFIKILLTKVFAILAVVLSFVLKKKSLYKNDWSAYFLTLSEDFVVKYSFVIYLISTVSSSLVAYTLFRIFKFQYPILLSCILLIVCMLITWLKYRRKEKMEIIEALYKVKKSSTEASEEQDNIQQVE